MDDPSICQWAHCHGLGLVPMEPASCFCQICVVGGKFGCLDKLGTACAFSAYDVGVGVACQPWVYCMNPIKGIFALFQTFASKRETLP